MGEGGREMGEWGRGDDEKMENQGKLKGIFPMVVDMQKTIEETIQTKDVILARKRKNKKRKKRKI